MHYQCNFCKTILKLIIPINSFHLFAVNLIKLCINILIATHQYVSNPTGNKGTFMCRNHLAQMVSGTPPPTLVACMTKAQNSLTWGLPIPCWNHKRLSFTISIEPGQPAHPCSLRPHSILLAEPSSSYYFDILEMIMDSSENGRWEMDYSI